MEIEKYGRCFEGYFEQHSIVKVSTERYIIEGVDNMTMSFGEPLEGYVEIWLTT